MMRMARPSVHDGALLAETEVEVEKSCATKAQLDAEFSVSCWVPAHRFVIHHSSEGVLKRRLIDDLCVSGHNETSVSGRNDTIQSQERLDHGGLDEVVVALARLLGHCLEIGVIDFLSRNARLFIILFVRNFWRVCSQFWLSVRTSV